MSNLSAYDFFNNYFDNDTFIEQFSKCQNIDLAKSDTRESYNGFREENRTMRLKGGHRRAIKEDFNQAKKDAYSICDY